MNTEQMNTLAAAHRKMMKATRALHRACLEVLEVNTEVEWRHRGTIRRGRVVKYSGSFDAIEVQDDATSKRKHVSLSDILRAMET